MTLHPITDEGLTRVLACLTPEDRAELDAADLGQTPHEVFSAGWRESTVSGLVRLDGQPVAIFGCVPNAGFGVPWMVATPAFRSQPRQAMAVSRQGMEQMQQAFPVLRNWVHAGHTYALRWLPRLGFKIGAARVGPGGAFRLFEWSATHV